MAISENKLHFVANPAQSFEASPRIEPSTCVEASSFALRVLDDSMEPEFAQNCIIIIDPTGHAKDGSFVLANKRGAEQDESITVDDAAKALEPILFRQLRQSLDKRWYLHALNEHYADEATADDFSDIIGVIVQRAGARRRYHKHYG